MSGGYRRKGGLGKIRERKRSREGKERKRSAWKGIGGRRGLTAKKKEGQKVKGNRERREYIGRKPNQ